MTLYLVRHADAKSRSGWRGPDVERTLTKKGARQAAAIAEQLGAAPIAAMSSSPAVRCLDTLAPLAAATGVQIRPTEALQEGADPRDAHALLLEHLHLPGDVLGGSPSDAVLCTHGDIIPAVLRRLARDGTKLDMPDRWAKGSTWELRVARGRIVSGRYHPPREAPS